MRSQKRAEAGFTLIELILVMVFLGVALVATMNVMSTSIEDSVKMELFTTALNLANKKLEQIVADKKNKGYGYIQTANYPSEVDAEGNKGFNRYVTVIDHSTYKEVRVRVTHAKLQDCVLMTYLTNY